MDPNEGTYMTNEEKQKVMKGTLNLHDIKNMPTIPEYDGIQKQYLEQQKQDWAENS